MKLNFGQSLSSKTGESWHRYCEWSKVFNSVYVIALIILKIWWITTVIDSFIKTLMTCVQHLHLNSAVGLLASLKLRATAVESRIRTVPGVTNRKYYHWLRFLSKINSTSQHILTCHNSTSVYTEN